MLDVLDVPHVVDGEIGRGTDTTLTGMYVHDITSHQYVHVHIHEHEHMSMTITMSVSMSMFISMCMCMSMASSLSLSRHADMDTHVLLTVANASNIMAASFRPRPLPPCTPTSAWDMHHSHRMTRLTPHHT